MVHRPWALFHETTIMLLVVMLVVFARRWTAKCVGGASLVNLHKDLFLSECYYHQTVLAITNCDVTRGKRCLHYYEGCTLLLIYVLLIIVRYYYWCICSQCKLKTSCYVTISFTVFMTSVCTNNDFFKR